MKPAIPNNEEARLEALRHYRILDSEPERSFDEITELASFICQRPVAMVSLVDSERQWFKSKLGLDITEAPREHSFCAHAIVQGSLMVVENAEEDARFADNPFVVGEHHVRFYAGAPLITPDGHGLGALCVIDKKPGKLSDEQASAMGKLAHLTVTQMELRRVSHELAEAAGNIRTLSGLLPICAHCKAIRDDSDYWQSVEKYITDNTEAIFSHGICPDCAKKHWPEFHEQMTKGDKED